MVNESTPLIETDRLTLRRFTQDDAQDILLIYGDEVANKFLPWFPIKSITEADQYLADSILPEYTKAVSYRYAIALKEDNRAIGYVNISDVGQSNDIGYGLRRDFWHQHITTEACAAVCDRFKAAGYPYITATHDINNPNSGEVMKKLGMTYRYSFDELWQPKNFMVTFRMYQIDFDDAVPAWKKYKKQHPYFVL